MKVKTNDQVKILSGKDAGKTGKVVQIFPKTSQVVVEGVNIIKKHLRPGKQGEKGRIIELAGAMAVSKVAVMCPKCQKPTRVGYGKDGEKKRRVCRVCKEFID